MKHCVRLWHYNLLGVFSKCPVFGGILKDTKNQLIRNALCMNQLAFFILFTECPFLMKLESKVPSNHKKSLE